MVFVYSIEGNIGSGKSTLIRELEKVLKSISYQCENKGNGSTAGTITKIPIVYLQEPVNEWNKITDKNGESILSKFYKDQEKYSFSFQMMAYISRIAALRQAIRENPESIIICERSVYTDYNVFAKMLYDDGKIEEVNYTIYKKWFVEFTRDIPITGAIYLNVSPENSHKRVIERNREGESIPLEYLINCNNYHDKWLAPGKDTSDSNLIIDGNVDIHKSPEIINDWVKIINTYVTNTSKPNFVP